MSKVFVVALAASLLAGCVTARGYGDQEFDKGNYNEALNHYEVAIKEGESDPALYHRAAKAAVATASFSQAERYYAQALRSGGDIQIARELADFYVRTSNYASAAHMYQYLLSFEKDPRPIYTNLGTALMYAGQPFEGESFLLLAHQLDPAAPIPYLNLAILYDQHLKQPSYSVRFYNCYLELSNQGEPNRAPVAQRVREIQDSHGRSGSEGMKCGEPIPPQTPVKNVDLKKEMAKVEMEFGDKDSVVGEEIVIEKMVEEIPAAAIPKGTSEADRRFLIGDYAAAVDLYLGQPAGELSALQVGRLGIGLARLERTAEAASWLEMALNRSASPEVVRTALGVYAKLENASRIRSLCQTFESDADYESIKETCKTLQKE